jgi:hypothetical protein
VAGAFWDVLPGGARAVAGALLLGALVALTLRPLVAQTWSVATASGWLAAAAVATFACAWGFHDLAAADERSAAREGGRSGWVAVAVAALLSVGAAVTLGLSASARLAQLAGALAAALLACAAVRLLVRSRRSLPGPGGALPLAVGYGGLLLSGAFYAELRWHGWLALALAPAAAALARRVSPASPRRSALTALLVAAVLVALAATPAIWSMATAEPDLYDY